MVKSNDVMKNTEKTMAMNKRRRHTPFQGCDCFFPVQGGIKSFPYENLTSHSTLLAHRLFIKHIFYKSNF